jgi:hypothetical protein
MLKNLSLNLFITLLVVTWGTGCKGVPKSKAFNLEVVLDERLLNSSVEVNLVGVNELGRPIWEQLKIDDYWDSILYHDAPKQVMKFGQGLEKKQTLPKKEAHWNQWLKSGSNYLYIIADIPNIISGNLGSADPRVLSLPLRKDCWKEKTVVVKIDSSQVQSLTPLECK